MKTKKDNPVIVFMGRYQKGEILSGPEKTARRLFEEHSKHNNTYFIQYFFDGKKYSIWQKLFGLEEFSINKGTVITAGFIRTYFLLKKLRPDIIHIINFERFAIIAAIYKLFNKVKILYNEHGVVAHENAELKKTGAWYRFKDKICEKRFLKSADKIVFVSENTIDIALRYFKFSEAKAVILANGVDSVFNKKYDKDYSGKIKAVFLYNSSLYRSGLEFLKKILKDITIQINVYVIAKTGLAKEIISGDVTIVNPMPASELAEFYGDKHIFFSLNEYDTFSISTAEAMASGLIPFITSQTGICRYIESGFNGYSFEYDDVQNAVNSLAEFSRLSQNEKHKISENARSIYESLNWGSIYETYRNVYKEMI